MATLCFVLHLSFVLLIFVNKQTLSLSLGRVFEEEYDDADGRLQSNHEVLQKRTLIGFR